MYVCTDQYENRTETNGMVPARVRAHVPAMLKNHLQDEMRRSDALQGQIIYY